MVKAEMVMRDDWQDMQSLRRYLAGQLRLGRMSVILGAGVSIPFGLPGWTDLVSSLFTAAGEAPPGGNHSPEELAEYLRGKRFANDWPGFIKAVHDALYRNDFDANLAKLRTHPTLAAIGALSMSSRRGSVSEIITFNFDNLLELYLRYHGFVSRSAFEDAHWAEYADVTVYHPHGWIPFSLSEGTSAKLVFDQQSYAQVIGKEGNPWRQLVTTIMRRRVCVFVGISGRDMNLDSMLLECQERHVSKQENIPFWGITFVEDDDKVTNGKWEARGVFPVKVGTYDPDIANILLGVCQDAAGGNV